MIGWKLSEIRDLLMTKARWELEAPHKKTVAAGRSLSPIFSISKSSQSSHQTPKENIKSVKMVKAGKSCNFLSLGCTLRMLLPEVGQPQRRVEAV